MFWTSDSDYMPSDADLSESESDEVIQKDSSAGPSWSQPTSRPQMMEVSLGDLPPLSINSDILDTSSKILVSSSLLDELPVTIMGASSKDRLPALPNDG